MRFILAVFSFLHNFIVNSRVIDNDFQFRRAILASTILTAVTFSLNTLVVISYITDWVPLSLFVFLFFVLIIFLITRKQKFENYKIIVPEIWINDYILYYLIITAFTFAFLKK